MVLATDGIDSGFAEAIAARRRRRRSIADRILARARGRPPTTR